MPLLTYNFSQIIQVFTAAAQAACQTLLDFSVGSVNLAYAEASAAVSLWLQGLILAILRLTRAATSVGPDLDTWMADFSFTRLPAVASVGQLTFARANPTTQAVIPIGATEQSQDGSQVVEVTLDTTNAAYSASAGGYVLPIGTASVTVPAVNTDPGSAGNVAAGTIVQISTTIPGVDTVTNTNPFTGGLEAESDPAFRARFALYLQGLESADDAAIQSAIQGVQQGITYLPVENYDYPGLNPDPGNFFVIINDGSGEPPSSLVTAVYNAIYAIRGFTIRFQVYAPTIQVVIVGMTIATAAGANHGQIVEVVEAALSAFINSLPLGTSSIPQTRLAQVAYDASPSVINVTGVTINGEEEDLALTQVQVAQAGTISVS